MKTLFFLLAGLWTATIVGGSELTARIRADAQTCADALVAGDYARLVSLTHPRIVDEMGGVSQAIEAITGAMTEMQAQGVAIESAVIAEPPDPVASGATVATIVPQILTLKTPKGRYRQNGNLLAVSEDGGATWRFIDTSSLDASSIAAYFPALAGLITLPTKSAPVLLAE